jgi:hypothetical protein
VAEAAASYSFSWEIVVAMDIFKRIRAEVFKSYLNDYLSVNNASAIVIVDNVSLTRKARNMSEASLWSTSEVAGCGEGDNVCGHGAGSKHMSWSDMGSVIRLEVDGEIVETRRSSTLHFDSEEKSVIEKEQQHWCPEVENEKITEECGVCVKLDFVRDVLDADIGSVEKKKCESVNMEGVCTTCEITEKIGRASRVNVDTQSAVVYYSAGAARNMGICGDECMHHNSPYENCQICTDCSYEPMEVLK